MITLIWGLILSFLLLEIALRWLLGMGNPLLYEKDDRTGYRLLPHQETQRFGKRVYINRYGFRSDEISLEKPENTVRILFLGDSIINGGWWTDQKNIISEQVKKGLENYYSNIEVLNASANSWGIRNELGYVEKYGLFNAGLLILVLNTDDLFALAPSSLGVGVDKNYPDRKPQLALIEFYQKYLTPSVTIHFPEEKGDRVTVNLEALVSIKRCTIQNNCEILLVLTPLKREVYPQYPRDYEVKAREKLEVCCQQENLSFIDFLPLFNQQENRDSLYRDHIHLSPLGNQLVSRVLIDYLLQMNLKGK